MVCCKYGKLHEVFKLPVEAAATAAVSTSSISTTGGAATGEGSEEALRFACLRLSWLGDAVTTTSVSSKISTCSRKFKKLVMYAVLGAFSIQLHVEGPKLDQLQMKCPLELEGLPYMDPPLPP